MYSKSLWEDSMLLESEIMDELFTLEVPETLPGLERSELSSSKSS